MFRGCHETKNQPSIKSLFLTTTAVFEEEEVNHFFYQRIIIKAQ